MATERRSAGSSRQQHRRSIISPKKQFSDKEISVLLSSGETFTPTGDFEKDFTELCQRNDLAPIRVTPRPHRPSSPSLLPPETSMSKGKDSKEDRNRSHQNHQPLPDVVKPSEDRLGEAQPSTYVTKDKFEYFQPRIEIETEDEGNKTYLKELYIKGKMKESLSHFALTHKEVVQRRLLLSKKASDEIYNRRHKVVGHFVSCCTSGTGPTPSSPTRGVGAVNSNQRPPSVKSGSHLKDDKKNRDSKGASKKKEQPQKSQKDGGASKKASGSDLQAKSSTKKDKKSATGKTDKKGQAQPDAETPELFEFTHPLLESAEEKDGELWIPGNRSLINLNLARNKITLEGVKILYKAIQYQTTLPNQLTKTNNNSNSVGLMRLSLQRNSFETSNPEFNQLCETMVTRDPFYKPPPQSPSAEAVFAISNPPPIARRRPARRRVERQHSW
eukprot:gene10243-11295_t